jgi:hypothetical protein
MKQKIIAKMKRLPFTATRHIFGCLKVRLTSPVSDKSQHDFDCREIDPYSPKKLSTTDFRSVCMKIEGGCAKQNIYP